MQLRATIWMAIDRIATVGSIGAVCAIAWLLISGKPPATSSPRTRPRGGNAVNITEISNIRTSINATTVVPRTAKVAIIEFSDFQCPYCGQFARETGPQLRHDFVDTGQLAYVFREFPLENIHPLAFKAGESAECARSQGKYWEMHDLLFGDQHSLERNQLLLKAQVLKLDARKFTKCLEGEMAEKIVQDQKEGMRLGISGTPTFLFGRIEPDGITIRLFRKLVGAPPYAAFKSAIESALRLGESLG